MAGDPTISMLWERDEPLAALADRFGFAGVGEAAGWLRETLRTAGIGQVEQCDRLVLSASNLLAVITVDGRRYVAKCCADPSRFARLREIDSLVAWLGAEGLPVAARHGDPRRAEREGISVGIAPMVGGDLVDVGDPEQVVAAGRALAELHVALTAYPLGIGADQHPPGEQLVHGDFRSANVLYARGPGITCVLDFDDVCYRSRTADLAQAAVLLGTRYHAWCPTEIGARTRFLAAYSEVAPLGSEERAALDRGITAVLGHFGWT